MARNNQQAGPYTLEQINQMLASQQVLLTDLAWHQGMPEWKALGELTQGKSVYEPMGQEISTPEPLSTQNNPISEPNNNQVSHTTQVIQLASIPSRILAKIIDLLLWLPATFLLTSFFTDDQKVQFGQLNEQFMTILMSSNPDAALAQQVQNEMFGLFPQQAIIAASAYVIIMLAIQAFLIAKSGQSIGKKITKIKIVDAQTAENTSLLRAFTIRSVFFIFLNIVSMPLSTIIDLVFGLGKKRQTLHDKLAKTQVIKQ